jgi:hypothetical protein
MKLRFAALLAIAALVTSLIPASAQENLRGRWRDNAPAGDPLGLLVISNESLTFGRKAIYRVKPAGAFGDGQLFEVTGLDRKQDPEGCGPDGRVRYIAVLPLPPIAPGVGGSAIRVFFYSGSSPPTVESIGNDIALCSIHPFGR